MSNHKNEPSDFPPVPGYKSFVPENLDQLKDLSGDRFCVKLNDIAICQIMDDKRIQACWKWFGNYEKAARMAVAQRNFGLVPKVNEHPNKYLALYELSNLTANIQRNIISRVILNKEHPFTADLLFEPSGREHYLVMLDNSLELAQAVDELNRQWMEDVLFSPIGQKISQLKLTEPQRLEQRLQQLYDCSFWYSIIEGDPDDLQSWKLVPYHIAFKYEIQATRRAISQMIFQLRALDEKALVKKNGKTEKEEDGTRKEKPEIKNEREEYVRYYYLLDQAYGSSSEEDWAAVDEAWVCLQGRVLPVHGFETGYFHPRCIEQEYRLLIKNQEQVKVNQKCERVKSWVLDFAKQHYQADESYKYYQNPLTNTEAAAYSTTVFSGIALAHRIGGQNVPNRELIRANVGAKISIDLLSTHIAKKSMAQLCRGMFGSQMAEKVLGIPVDIFAVDHTVGHEEGHFLWMTPETIKQLGHYYYCLEEGKASITSCVVEGALFQEGKVEETKMQDLFLATLARIPRILMMRTNPAIRNYIYENLMMLEAALESNVISLKKSGEYYPADIENKDKRAAFFDTLNKYFSELHQIYNTGDSQGAADLSNRLDKLYASDLVQEFLKQVDKVAQKAE